jgi:type IV pilus assembly protein PilC
MPKFAYTAIDSSGASVDGSTKAETVGAVRALLIAKDLVPLRIAEVQSGININIGKPKLKKKELMHFSRQLSVFVKAGISIIEALETIAEEAQDRVMRKVIAEMIDDLRQGSTFIDAANKHPDSFPAYYLGVLGSAELTGNLDDTLDKLAGYIERDLAAKQKVTAALAYPGVVVAMAFVTVFILAGFVLPQFKTLFEELGSDLPFSTRLLLGFSSLFGSLWYITASFVAVFAGGIAYLMSSGGRKVRDKLMLTLPVIKGIVHYSILERFCRVLSALIEGGVALPEAMKVTIDSTSNTVFTTRLEDARQQMMGGSGFTAPLVETEMFPGAARQMFKVGEETGTLDKQLEVAAIYFDRELEMRIRRFTNAFEPAMIVFVGVIVGFVAVSLVQAMYGIIGGLKQQ